MPVQTDTDGACETGILESVIAEDDVEFVLNLLGGPVAVFCRDDFYFRGMSVAREMSRVLSQFVLQHDKFVPGGTMAKDGNLLILFLKTPCKPDGKRRLACAANQVTPDDNDGNV